MLFDILNKFSAVPAKIKSDRIERALVVASDIKRSADLYYWRFSTLGANDAWKPDFSAYGDHPVSGTREFGTRAYQVVGEFVLAGATANARVLSASMYRCNRTSPLRPRGTSS
mgnify:CR=1 FL=1